MSFDFFSIRSTNARGKTYCFILCDKNKIYVLIIMNPVDLERRIQSKETEEPQILIMDIKFDGEDGISAVKRMQKKVSFDESDLSDGLY